MTRRLRLAALTLLLAGCHAPMSVFTGAGPAGRALSQLTWVLVAASAVIFVLVTLFMLAAIARRNRGGTDPDLTVHDNRIPIVAGAIIPGVVLLALFMTSVLIERRIPGDASTPAESFTVIGHQWWWGVERDDSASGRRAMWANELHVPVGEPVDLTLLSDDVIHSFWIPQVHGKIDLIPGDTNHIRFVADRPGVYRGQCAEYCGMQHANMAFTLVVESPVAYRAWLSVQRADAKPPTDTLAALGRAQVVNGPCATCHTIRGTTAQGEIGPDLTHVGSRVTLAAGTLPNDLATMEAWVTNAPSLKPGVKMPAMPQFTGLQLRAIAAYLEGLR
ncbi:MAG TPA: cytochrome c oxidase subunit II [Gemmatimonadales bacterium]